ncbi:MAG: hypothetical protein KDK70_40185, partial [Myxococcales bacterium]|nr:hypothetical protein [Myxococcales bacterium]
QVELRDLPGTEVEIRTPFRVVNWLVGMTQAIARPERHDRPDLEAAPPEHDGGAAQVEAATETIPNGPYGPPPILMTFGGRMGGLADLALRRGQRKQTRAKEAFLERTAPLRAALARQHARARQQAALGALGQELATMWRDSTRSEVERKRAVFELWDECEESIAGGSEADAERGAAAEEARRRIERFVRRVAPPGSAMAYSADDLARLNAGRRSRQRFEPYAPQPTRARDETGTGTGTGTGIVAR